MILIPQIYIRNGKVVLPEKIVSPIIKEDPVATAHAMKESGAEAIYCIDLGITPVGTSPHVSIIKKMHDETGLAIYAGGAFKTKRGIEAFINAGSTLIVLGSQAYQQPAFLTDICKSLPGKVATHIDVKSGHVTIPGYAVVSNKTAFDYAEQFISSGVRYIFYSDVGAGGLMTNENFDNLLKFCNKVTARVFCTSEISGLSNIEQMVKLGAARLDGLVLAKTLYEGKIDLRSSIAMVNDLTIAISDESTMTEM